MSNDQQYMINVMYLVGAFHNIYIESQDRGSYTFQEGKLSVKSRYLKRFSKYV
jgi:hypothetical protein